MSVSADGLEIVSGPPGSKRGQYVPAGLGGDVKTAVHRTCALTPSQENAGWIVKYSSLKGGDSGAVLSIRRCVPDSVQWFIERTTAEGARIERSG